MPGLTIKGTLLSLIELDYSSKREFFVTKYFADVNI
jgi:hypothetical protein